MKSYGGKLGEMDLQYSDCILIVTIEGGELKGYTALRYRILYPADWTEAYRLYEG